MISSFDFHWNRASKEKVSRYPHFRLKKVLNPIKDSLLIKDLMLLQAFVGVL